jgi:hypothetical protein
VQIFATHGFEFKFCNRDGHNLVDCNGVFTETVVA